MEESAQSKVIAILSYDVWGYLTERFNISPKRKLDYFMGLSLVFSLIMEIFVIRSGKDIYRITGFSLFISTMLWMIGIMLNDKVFYKIKSVYLWELLFGGLVILSAFILVTPFKQHFFPETRSFGVLNGGVIIIGLFLMFYGLRNYKVTLPYVVIYGLFILLNPLWNFLAGSPMGYSLAGVSSKAAYEVLKFLGYSVFLNGTTISIVSSTGEIVSATIAGLCSGVEGITFSIMVLVLLFMGTGTPYNWRVISITIAAILMFFINILRLVIIFIFAYYFGYSGLESAHTWVGDILFLLFIIPYWMLINRKLVKSGEQNAIEDR